LPGCSHDGGVHERGAGSSGRGKTQKAQEEAFRVIRAVLLLPRYIYMDNVIEMARLIRHERFLRPLSEICPKLVDAGGKAGEK